MASNNTTANLFAFSKKINWNWGLVTAFAVTILMLLPQINLWTTRSMDWQGSFAIIQEDEVAYAAYINSLIDGRPRKNDPYSGRDDEVDAHQAESLFSIQFIPAYAIAIPARIWGGSASSAFIVLNILVPFLSCLVIFWLIFSITANNRLAATGVIIILCLGTLAAAQGELRASMGANAFQYFPFLRRYQPALTFPLFFLFCAVVWHTFKSRSMGKSTLLALAAGLILGLLIFSYYFFWTAAVAWLLILTLITLITRSDNRKQQIVCVSIISAITFCAIVPYLYLLSQRAENMDSTQGLILTRMPDLWRVPMIIGIVVFFTIVYSIRRNLISWQNQATIFAASFALTPVLLFNQQIVTGRSLQPIHYADFVANYLSLLAVVITSALIFHKRFDAEQRKPNRALFFIALISFGWGVIEATGLTARTAAHAKLRDEMMPVVRWFAHRANHKEALADVNSKSRPLIFSTNLSLADNLPIGAPQAVLWAPHMHAFSGVTSAENKERFYQYLYYAGITEQQLAQALSEGEFYILLALFGFDRAVPELNAQAKPVTTEEMRVELRRYSQYVASFSHEQVFRTKLSYLVAPIKAEPDYSRLDQWYQREAGKQVGEFIIYQLKPLPQQKLQ